MPSCVFNKCQNHSGKLNKTTGITFHSFPRDELWKYKWVFIVRIERQQPNWVSTVNSRICSAHFKMDDIYLSNKGLRRIKKGAVPFLQITSMSPLNSVQNSGYNTPDSPQHIDASDLVESILESPRKVFYKQKIRKIRLDKRKLVMKIKYLKSVNQRLSEKNYFLKRAVHNLKKKLNLQKNT